MQKILLYRDKPNGVILGYSLTEGSRRRNLFVKKEISKIVGIIETVNRGPIKDYWKWLVQLPGYKERNPRTFPIEVRRV